MLVIREEAQINGETEDKNIDGVFAVSLVLTGANMKQHCWFISFMSFLPSQLEQASEKCNKRHWIHVCHEPERAATGPGAQIH